MTPTTAQLNRTKTDWTNYSNESIELEYIKGTIYGFGSELATLRLLAKYRNCKNARIGYSTNLSTHFFALDIN